MYFSEYGKMFINLGSAGKGKIEHGRINVCMTTLSRNYNFYSDIHGADDIEVILPQEAEEDFLNTKKEKLLFNRLEN